MNRITISIVIGVVVVAGAGFLAWQKFHPTGGAGTQCTLEAKICPDGTAVGRTGPNCEFQECPTATGTEGWKTSTDAAEGVTFKYPENLSTTYIQTVDWPPLAAVTDGPFACAAAGSEIAPSGKTELRTISGREYCVTTETEGAAGSIYTMYAYAFDQSGKVVILTFTLRATQCANYDDPQKTACEGERETFDIDGVVDRIAATLELIPASSGATGIRGTVLLGPTCPVMRNPPDPACADKPYATALVLTTVGGARVITQFNSDAKGAFTVAVVPGEYAIRSAAGANILPRCATNETVSVVAGRYASTTVYCDTGIR